MNVIVIEEFDSKDNSTTVIGVASSIDKAQTIVNEYYGHHTLIKEEIVEDSGIEKLQRIGVSFGEIWSAYTLIYRSFILNDL